MKKAVLFYLLILGSSSLAVFGQIREDFATVAECPLERHPEDETLFIQRGPLGEPVTQPCPHGTYFVKTLCTCVPRPEKCTLRASRNDATWYEQQVHGGWIPMPCGPGTAYNPMTCSCSIFH